MLLGPSTTLWYKYDPQLYKYDPLEECCILGRSPCDVTTPPDLPPGGGGAYHGMAAGGGIKKTLQTSLRFS